MEQYLIFKETYILLYTWRDYRELFEFFELLMNRSHKNFMVEVFAQIFHS